MRRFADFSSIKNTSLGIIAREFGMVNSVERNCLNTDLCGKTSRTEQWGAKLTTTSYQLSFTTLVISNEKHFGLFMHHGFSRMVIEKIQNLDVLIANVTLEFLLIRWVVALVAMYSGYRLGAAELQSVGIGVLSRARGFNWLTILLLPRVKTNFTILSTIGCVFEGPQKALGDAWLGMYPGIAELVVVYFSIRNLILKATHCRMSDTLFGPTLLFFCLMHWFRYDLAQSGWLEFDGRTPPVVTSAEFDRVSVLDFFASDISFRLNGNVRSLFLIKFGVLGLNLLSLLWSKRVSSAAAKRTGAEDTLAMYCSCSDGLGVFTTSKHHRLKSSSTQDDQEVTTLVLSGYELIRLGYLVLAWEIAVSSRSTTGTW